MYFNTASDYESVITLNKVKPVSYAEVLETMIETTEIFSEADFNLLRSEFRMYKIGNEGVGNFFDNIKIFVRKMLEALKNLGSKLISYISTVPGRIGNFVMRVSNWASKIGLEQNIKNMMAKNEQLNIDNAELEAFTHTDFGPLDWTGLMTGDGASDRSGEAQDNQNSQNASAKAKEIQGKKVKFIQAMNDFVSTLPKFIQALANTLKQPIVNRAVNQNNQAQANATAAKQQGAANIETRNDQAVTQTRMSIVEWFANENKNYNILNAIENIKDALTVPYFEQQVPPLNTVLARVKLVTNGTIQKDADRIISGIKRAQQQVEAHIKATTAMFDKAIAGQDNEACTNLKVTLSGLRDVYSWLIKSTVRCDSAAQHITSNVIKWAKAAMDCYTKRTNPNQTQENPNAQGSNIDNNGNPVNNTTTSDSAQDFSHIFDF